MTRDDLMKMAQGMAPEAKPAPKPGLLDSAMRGVEMGASGGLRDSLAGLAGALGGKLSQMQAGPHSYDKDFGDLYAEARDVNQKETAEKMGANPIASTAGQLGGTALLAAAPGLNAMGPIGASAAIGATNAMGQATNVVRGPGTVAGMLGEGYKGAAIGAGLGALGEGLAGGASRLAGRLAPSEAADVAPVGLSSTAEPGVSIKYGPAPAGVSPAEHTSFVDRMLHGTREIGHGLHAVHGAAELVGGGLAGEPVMALKGAMGLARGALPIVKSGVRWMGENPEAVADVAAGGAKAVSAAANENPTYSPMAALGVLAGKVPALAQAQAQGGNQGLAAAHYVQSQTSEPYRALMSKLQGGRK